MNTYIILYRPGPLGPVVRELTVRAPNMPQAFEQADSKLRLRFPNYKLEQIALIHQVHVPASLEQAIERMRSER